MSKSVKKSAILKSVILLTFITLLSALNSPLSAFIYPNLDNYQLGLQFLSNQNYGQSLYYFEKADQLDPNNPTILNSMANALHKKAEFEQANEYYEQALSALNGRINRTDDNPKTEQQLIFNQGNNYYRMQQYDKAVENYKRVLDLDDQNYSAKKNLEIALKKLQQQSQDQQNKQDQQNQDKDNQNNQKNQRNQEENSPKNNHDKDQPGNDQKQQSKQDQQSSDQKNGQQNGDQKKSQAGDQEKKNSSKPESKSEQKGSAISLKRAEEILKAFSEKEVKTKGFNFYKQEKSAKKNRKNW